MTNIIEDSTAVVQYLNPDTGIWEPRVVDRGSFAYQAAYGKAGDGLEELRKTWKKAPVIRLFLSGQYQTPHLIMQIGNRQTRMHSEQYSTRSNARRALRTLVKVLEGAGGCSIEVSDETVQA